MTLLLSLPWLCDSTVPARGGREGGHRTTRQATGQQGRQQDNRMQAYRAGYGVTGLLQARSMHVHSWLNPIHREHKRATNEHKRAINEPKTKDFVREGGFCCCSVWYALVLWCPCPQVRIWLDVPEDRPGFYDTCAMPLSVPSQISLGGPGYRVMSSW